MRGNPHGTFLCDCPHPVKNPLPFGKRDNCKERSSVARPSPPAPLPKRGEGSETFAARIFDGFSIDPVRGTASLDARLEYKCSILVPAMTCSGNFETQSGYAADCLEFRHRCSKFKTCGVEGPMARTYTPAAAFDVVIIRIRIDTLKHGKSSPRMRVGAGM